MDFGFQIRSNMSNKGCIRLGFLKCHKINTKNWTTHFLWHMTVRELAFKMEGGSFWIK